MKQQAKEVTVLALQTATKALEIILREDIKSRKKVKASQKNRWTSSINKTKALLSLISEAKRLAKSLPGRVG